MTSQRPHTTNKWPPYATEWTPSWKFSAYATAQPHGYLVVFPDCRRSKRCVESNVLCYARTTSFSDVTSGQRFLTFSIWNVFAALNRSSCSNFILLFLAGWYYRWRCQHKYWTMCYVTGSQNLFSRFPSPLSLQWQSSPRHLRSSVRSSSAKSSSGK